MQTGTKQVESAAEVKSEQAFIFDHATTALAQMAVEGRVLFEPPKTWPGECDVARSHPLQSLQFMNCGVVVGRLPVVLAVALQEGEHTASDYRVGDSQLSVIHQDDRLLRWNKLRQLDESARGPLVPIS